MKKNSCTLKMDHPPHHFSNGPPLISCPTVGARSYRVNVRTVTSKFLRLPALNLVPRACDPQEGTRGSGIIRCRKPGILAKIELRIPFQRPIRFLPETDYPRASRSFPRIAGSGNEIVQHCATV